MSATLAIHLASELDQNMSIREWINTQLSGKYRFVQDKNDERDTREASARFEIAADVAADPLSEVTRKIRRSLLALSVLALVVNARLPIEKLPYLGDQPSEVSLTALLGLLSIGIAYYLFSFIVSVGNEYLHWRDSGNATVFRQTNDNIRGIAEQVRRASEALKSAEENKHKDNVARIVREAESTIPDLKKRFDRSEDYYVSLSRVQMIRVVGLEISLPLIVAFFALWKVAPQVWPMLVQIVTA